MHVWAEKMDQQSQALATLAENKGLVPSTHMVAHTHPQLQFQVI